MKRYEKYKDSGVEWLGEIPEHWEVKPVKHSFIVNMGQSPDSSNCNNDGLGMPFLQGNAAFGKVSPKPDTWCTELNKKSNENDVLVSVRAPIGAVNISDREYGIGRGLCAISGECFKFIYYLFISLSEELNAHGTGSTFKAISVEQLKNISIPVPLNQEQHNISDYLDYKTAKTDELITEKETLITKLQEKRKALINEVVTKGLNPKAAMKDSGIEWLGMIPEHWKVVRVKSIVNLLNDKISNSGSKKVGLENIESKTGRYIETDSSFEGEGVEFVNDDILFGKLRPYLAKVYLSEFCGQAVGDFYVFRARKNAVPQFLANLFISDFFISVVDGSTYGAKMPRANWDFISNIEVAIPTLQEQSQIVNHIESRTTKIDQTVEELRTQIEKLKEYKLSVISEAVTGKVDVREWKAL